MLGGNAIKVMFLESLGNGIPALDDVIATFYKANCMICLDHHNHRTGTRMYVSHVTDTSVEIQWDGDVSSEMRLRYANLKSATDFGACAIALLLVRDLTGYTAIEQSVIGTTIDYYLAPQNDDTLIFNRAARLEVSGILEENEKNTVDSRIKDKIKRLKPEGSLPDLIVVVEFSKPWARMVKA